MSGNFQTRRWFQTRKRLRETESVVVDAAAQVVKLREMAGRQRTTILKLRIAAGLGWLLAAGQLARTLLNHGH